MKESIVEITVDNQIRLRHLVDADAYALNSICQDDSFMHFLPELSDLIRELGAIHVLDAFEKYYTGETGLLLGIEHTGIIVGFIACMDLKTSPTIFYAMHNLYRERGIMTKSLTPFIEFLFDRGLCNSISTTVMKENFASIVILQNVGFKTIEINNTHLIMMKKK